MDKSSRSFEQVSCVFVNGDCQQESSAADRSSADAIPFGSVNNGHREQSSVTSANVTEIARRGMNLAGILPLSIASRLSRTNLLIVADPLFQAPSRVMDADIAT